MNLEVLTHPILNQNTNGIDNTQGEERTKMLRKLKLRSESDQDTVATALVTLQGHPGSASSSISSVEDRLNDSPIPHLPLCDDTTLKGKVVIIEAPSLKGFHTSVASSPNSPRLSSSTKRKKCSSDSHVSKDSPLPSSIVSIVSVEKAHLAKKPRLAPMHFPNKPGQPISLLADPGDEHHLNKLHCFARRNIEWFVATAKDIAVPSPGRKTALRIGQIGLRCIHCRQVYCRDRTKRAICYPTSVSRIYHCVSDMKFDHFPNCQYLPENERKTFNDLKSSSRNGKKGKGTKGKQGSPNGNTAQYYYRAAVRLGMQDSKGFVSLQKMLPTNPISTFNNISLPSLSSYPVTNEVSDKSTIHPGGRDGVGCNRALISSRIHNTHAIPFRIQPYTHALSKETNITKASPPVSSSDTPSSATPFVYSIPPRSLAAPEDESFLNPIHCFVRKNVEVFAATEKDITAPAPGRKNRVTFGQVGIRCIHCSKLPLKQRVKRAICYPPSITSIYHSVSNMKFDHFGACRGLPPSERQKFAALRTSSGKRGTKRTGCNLNGTTANSTSQYYRQSAITQLGLVDTNAGIRIRKAVSSVYERPYTTSKESERSSPTDGMSFLMMAATNPDLRKLYENQKAKNMDKELLKALDKS